jgi:two-component system OmpR family response regulator
MLQSMDQTPHILIVDDDREIRDLLALFLEKQRIRVTAARDAKEARRAWLNGHYQLVVLDLMLPGESGLDLARWLRTQSEIPIVMLTAMGEETDRIIGLELGADDYMPKPFNPRELLARIRAVLRRSGDPAEVKRDPSARGYRFNNWTVEPARRRTGCLPATCCWICCAAVRPGRSTGRSTSRFPGCAASWRMTGEMRSL